MKCSLAPGKVLLFGEHFVVKGKPALGLAVDKYVKVCVNMGEGRVFSAQLGEIDKSSKHRALFDAVIKEVHNKYGDVPRLNIYVDSNIPIGSGMGSSASIATALSHAVLSYMGVVFSREDITRIAHEAEKAVHYKPSGVDTTLATYGGFLYFKQGSFKRLEVKLPESIVLIVVNTGIERFTGQVVREVLERYERIRRAGEYIYMAAEELVEEAIRAIHEKDLELLGELMLVNHGLLWAMGASILTCDSIVYELVKHGAYGGKLSGAGRGGIVIGLVDSNKLPDISRVLRERGYFYMIARPDYEGVRETQL